MLMFRVGYLMSDSMELLKRIFGTRFTFYRPSRVDIARFDEFRRRALRDFTAWKKHASRCRRGRITNWVRGPWSARDREAS